MPTPKQHKLLHDIGVQLLLPPSDELVLPDEFIQVIPKIKYTFKDISNYEFLDLLQRLRDSAPGPDGLPYSIWKHTASTLAEFLWAALQALLAGAPPPPGFNSSILVFLAKGPDPTNSTTTTRTPSCTRPLNLSNSDQKILAKLLDSVLAPFAAQMVHPAQHGSLKGRSIVDVVGKMETNGLLDTVVAL